MITFLGMFPEMIRSFLIKLEKISGKNPAPELFQGFWGKKSLTFHHHLGWPTGGLVVRICPATWILPTQTFTFDWILLLSSRGKWLSQNMRGFWLVSKPGHFQNWSRTVGKPPSNHQPRVNVHYYPYTDAKSTDPSPRWASIAFGTSRIDRNEKNSGAMPLKEVTWHGQTCQSIKPNIGHILLNIYIYYMYY